MGKALSVSEFDGYRDSIVDAAISLISREGAQALTIRALAHEAGCNRQTPYRFFRGKDTIVAEAFLRCHTIFTTYCEEAVQNLVDPYEKLVAIRNAYLRFAHDEPQAYEVAFSMDAPTDDPRVLTQVIYAWNSLRGLFQSAHDAGLVKGDPDHLSYLYWSNLHMLALFQKSDASAAGLNLATLAEMVDQMFFGDRPQANTIA